MRYSSALVGAATASLLVFGVASAQTSGTAPSAGDSPSGLSATNESGDMTCATFLELGMAGQAAALLPRLAGNDAGGPGAASGGSASVGATGAEDGIGTEFNDMSGPIASDVASPSAGITSFETSNGSGATAETSATGTPQATGTGGDEDLQLVPVVNALLDQCTTIPNATMTEAVRSARELARSGSGN